MGLPKGRTNNPGGRKKGVITLKSNAKNRAFIESFLKRNRRLMQRDWMFMSEYQRVVMFEKLTAYTTPKAVPENDFENLTEEQLDKLLNRLIESNERQQAQIPITSNTERKKEIDS